jgi:hypothetical protein
MRRASKRDANETAIIEALRAVGAWVKQLDFPSDLAVRFRRKWSMLEVKDEGGKLTAQQEKDHAALDPGAIPIVRTPEEALKAIGAINA